MKVDINRLAEHFARTSFQVESVAYYMRKPGMQLIGGHTDPFCGFVFPLGGRAEFTFNGTPYTVLQGNVVHGGPKMTIDRRVVGKENWEYLLVHYRIIGNEPQGFSLTDTHFELQTGQSPRMTELLLRLHQVSSQPGGIAAFKTETLFRDVLNEMFVCARNQTNRGSQALFEHTSSYIHEHYADALNIPRLAQQSGVNRNRLAYVFKKYAGMGPGDYLLQYRLNRAKELLLANKAPLYEVAQIVGFNDPFHFSKMFKKQFGISPSEFRKKFINNTC